MFETMQLKQLFFYVVPMTTGRPTSCRRQRISYKLVLCLTLKLHQTAGPHRET